MMNKKMMKNVLRHIAPDNVHKGLVVLCGLLLGACRQEELPEVKESGDAIAFHATETLTRGFLDDGNLTTEGTRLCMYGYYNGNVLGGTSKPMAGKPLAYGTYGDETEARWSIVDDSGSPVTYYWQGDGDYKFFGWLAQDAAGSLEIPATWTYDETSKTLTIPETTLDKDYNQFDFLYADVVNRTVSGGQGKEAVPLSMNHLFTAFGIGISNSSEDDITINEITLRCIHDRGSAVIDFDGAPDVAYGTTGKSYTTSYITYTGSYTIPAKTGVKYNAFDPTATDKKYYMLWPQAEEVVHPGLSYVTEEDKLAETDLSKFPLVIKYTVGGETLEKRMEFPAKAWEAGKLHYFDLVVADKLVELTATVTPWDFVSAQIDYANNVITVKADNHLKYDESTCTVDHDDKRAYITNGQAAEATFCIDTPRGGTWRVSLVGDIEAFEIHVDENHGHEGSDDYRSGQGPIDGQVHRIRIAPAKGYESPDRDYEVQLRFVAITSDGITLNADDMLQDSDNSGGADYYTIVNRKS